jgi:tRNA U34 5-methylaminomethyl-2-thiouridine-forming methyltransferase MnmC
MRHKPQEIKILEIGFGPGLNALLTLIESFKADVNIKYHAIDNFPLDDAIVWALNYEKMVSADRPNLFFQLHKASWDVEVELSAQFALEKKKIDIITIDDLGRGIYDLVYFDAFAPAKQPEMWSLQVLTTVIRAIRQGGVLVTYCAKGQLKRDLSNLNMEVETLQGPSGKKEMVRATVLF